MRHVQRRYWSEARALLCRDARALLILRRAPDTSWEFPGGRLLPNESPPTGLVRLCRLMLGIDIDIVGGAAHSEYNCGFQAVRCHYFVCGTTREPDHRNHWHEARWVLVPQLREYYFDTVTQHVVDRLLDSLPR